MTGFEMEDTNDTHDSSPMKREIIITADGSHSISVPLLNSTYHSSHGAIMESQHVFIESGLHHYRKNNTDRDSSINIFEMGFGTGLNALLTLIETEKLQQPVYYETVEAYPLTEPEYRSLNYCKQLKLEQYQPLFERLHSMDWGKETTLTDFFTCKKSMHRLADHCPNKQFHIVYFDAFAPDVQPELWTTGIFTKIFSMLAPGGILVTYCSKTVVRKTMTAAGFTVHKIPGPPHKREMVRAVKNKQDQ